MALCPMASLRLVIAAKQHAWLQQLQSVAGYAPITNTHTFSKKSFWAIVRKCTLWFHVMAASSLLLLLLLVLLSLVRLQLTMCCSSPAIDDCTNATTSHAVCDLLTEGVVTTLDQANLASSTCTQRRAKAQICTHMLEPKPFSST